MDKPKTKILTLREFSHYTLGTIDGGVERAVPTDIAEALIGMGLAERVKGADGQAQQEPQQKPQQEPQQEPAKAAAKPRSGKAGK